MTAAPRRAPKSVFDPRVRARFERLIARPSGTKAKACFIWTGARDGKGLPQFRVGAKVRGAQRVAWELSSGLELMPEEAIVRTCGNRICVRVEHLQITGHAGQVGGAMQHSAAVRATINGETLTVAEWCERLKIVAYTTALRRVRKGMSPEQAVTAAPGPFGPPRRAR